MKILVVLIVGIMALYVIIIGIQEWIDDRKLQKEQDELKNKY